ncbi:hypothetical protein E2C01_028692 [Portunus trituberculatus]|uniref:Uncharacterized protein n=1 Tax=Portunus trituberculatus TaxID=210409 RepID=A0A5B7EM69_PORTR|nr:hypothetical protein [Portunus trituberculatus]
MKRKKLNSGNYGETAKEKDLKRTAEERASHYWKVKDMSLRKWYTRREYKMEISITGEEEEY